MSRELCSTIFFDKDKSTAQSFEFDSFNESAASNTMTISVRYDVSADSSIPDFKPFKDLTFSTMEITDKAGTNIPYFGSYTNVEDVNVNYFGGDNIYTVNVILR